MSPTMTHLARWSAFGLVLAACSSPDAASGVSASAAADDSGEPAENVEASAVISQDETGDPAALAPQPLDVTEVDGFVDVRGVGDSAWANTHESPPRAAEFDQGPLHDFDSERPLVQGPRQLHQLGDRRRQRVQEVGRALQLPASRTRS